jgi:hypothetical protein
VSWRDMEEPDRVNFISWADAELNARWLLGDQRYNSSHTGFKGNPIDHAIEEALDLLVYLWIAKRREDANY